MGLRILPSYIFREFLKAFFLCFLCFIFMFLLIDIQNVLPSDLGILESILLLFFSISNKLIYALPSSFFLSSMYISYTLSRNNEILAFQVSGISFFSAYKQVFYFCFYVMILMMLINFFIIPKGEEYTSFLNNKKRSSNAISFSNYENQKIKYFWVYKEQNQKIQDISLLKINGSGNLISDLFADTALYKDKKLFLNDVRVFNYTKEPQILTKNQKVEDFFIKDSSQRLRLNQREERIEFYKKILSPFLSLGVLTIGMGFAITSQRKGLNFLTPFLLICIFLISSRIAIILVKRMQEGPVFLPLVLPLIIFTFIGVYKIVRRS